LAGLPFGSIRRCSSTVEHRFRKAGVEGSNPPIGFLSLLCRTHGASLPSQKLIGAPVLSACRRPHSRGGVWKDLAPRWAWRTLLAQRNSFGSRQLTGLAPMRQALGRLGKAFFAGGTKRRAFAFGAAAPSQELLRRSNAVNAISPVIGRRATEPGGASRRNRCVPLSNDSRPLLFRKPRQELRKGLKKQAKTP
jgi:hypothetical protein